MKAYIVYLPHLPQSVDVMMRAADSAAKFNMAPYAVSGVWRDQAREELRFANLKIGKFDESWSNTDAVIGNFVSQYRIWCEIAGSGHPAIIMEHDAVVIAPIPDVPVGIDICTFGKPSFGKYKASGDGFTIMSNLRDKIPGAHGYYLTPNGARMLAEKAHEIGALPVDKFISPQRFVIAEYYPWPIEAHDSFTTIQHVKGCRSKHNWNGKYKIL